MAIGFEWPWHVMWPCHGIRILATYAIAIRFDWNAMACDGINTCGSCHAMAFESNGFTMASHVMAFESNGLGM